MFRVSTELYTDITHFILELIQNADDNNYANNIEPTLILRLSRQQLIVECNETGFTEKDVRAICKVNASTKKWRKGVLEGCIGEKGIGIRHLRDDWVKLSRIQVSVLCCPLHSYLF